MTRILYVDDEPTLLDLAKIFLEKEGTFSIDTLTSAPEALIWLKTERYDAIISDYQMPEMDGIMFLKYLKASGDTTPFIIFTGRGREEVVIEALNNGADFYIQKGGDVRSQFAELSNKVRYAVSRKHAEEALSESQKRTAQILEFLPDATFAVSAEGTVIAWNRAMEVMTGLGKEEILSKGNFEASLPFYRERRSLLLSLVLNPDDSMADKYPFIRKEGDRIISEIFHPGLHDGNGAYLWIAAAPLYDAQGKISGAIELIHDITERRGAENALIESRRQLDAMAANIPGVVVRFSAGTDGITGFDYISKRCREVLGLENDPAGFFDGLAEHIVPEDREQFFTSVQHAISKKGLWDVECRYIRPSGEKIWISGVSSPSMENDRLIFDGVISDITGRKCAEEELLMKNEKLNASYEQIAAVEEELRSNFNELAARETALRESEEKFRTLFESAGDAIFTMDHGIFLDCNRRSEQMFGCTRDRIIGKSPLTFSPERQPGGQLSAEMAQEHIDASYLGETRFFEWVHVRADGTPFTTEVSLNRLMVGSTHCLQAIVRDITERKCAEEELLMKNEKLNASHEQIAAVEEELRSNFNELAAQERARRESEAHLNCIIQGSPLPQFVIDNDHRLISWNRALEECSGIKEADVLGTRDQWKAFYDTKRPVLADLLVDGRIELLPEWYQDTVLKSRLVEGAYEGTGFFPGLGKAGKWLYFTTTPIRNADGKITGAVETLEDITWRKKTEDALLRANKKLAMLNNITRHDICNQLTALLSYIHISKKQVTDPGLQEYISKEEQIAHVIQGQIDFARTYQDIGGQAASWVGLSALIDSATGQLKPFPVEINIAGNGIEIFADPLIGKVFYNLIDNSLRHGGHVTRVDFSVQHTDRGLVLACSDNGTGIVAEDKENLFQKGFGKNTGLGLFLSREILSITGMTITETGEPGKGARFEMTVPKEMWRIAAGQ
ncbi:PAS domain S-box protein [uncultured Methanoregula sp.]|uniref:PAS domain S-box protein n=1 Tax=uncultured Methanoregula sp. TaxID=1005933 RepID=UPI002AAAA997|nr:PAS domain S-box protein [uncultured Methanoregula sp.]